ncbi:Rrf2 family transcriptional regulator [Corynebacterium matruchotii]|uniref:Rrf2 family transcriptional regulator n=1 Tax=Corynebacterium matruchotii TaxID=43768 RepID=UPI0028E1F5A0|nr:Rrf2 family transcriptional regulator [Corynebacterium matruchotii]
MDVKFSVAIHTLVMISESKKALSSQALATSVGTNASYIRKIISLLKTAGLVSSHQGRSGYQLTKSPEEITLLEIYYAAQAVDHISLFQLHQNSNQECPVGKHINEATAPIFTKVEKHLEEKLACQTLGQIIDNLYQKSKT